MFKYLFLYWIFLVSACTSYKLVLQDEVTLKPMDVDEVEVSSSEISDANPTLSRDTSPFRNTTAIASFHTCEITYTDNTAEFIQKEGVLGDSPRKKILYKVTAEDYEIYIVPKQSYTPPSGDVSYVILLDSKKEILKKIPVKFIKYSGRVMYAPNFNKLKYKYISALRMKLAHWNPKVEYIYVSVENNSGSKFEIMKFDSNKNELKNRHPYGKKVTFPSIACPDTPNYNRYKVD